MNNPSVEPPFIVRNAAPITMFLVGLVCLTVGFIVPEEWRPFEPIEVGRWFGIAGVPIILFGAYLWKLCNPKAKKNPIE